MKEKPESALNGLASIIYLVFVIWGITSFINWYLKPPISQSPPLEIDTSTICRNIFREMVNSKTQTEVDSAKPRAIAAKCSDLVINYKK